MCPAAQFSRDVTVGLDLTQLENLRPYASFQIARYPRARGKLENFVDGLVKGLPSLLDEILVDSLVAEIGELLRTNPKPPWFRHVADLLNLKADDDADALLSALDDRLRGSDGRPPVTVASGKSTPQKSDLATQICGLVGVDPLRYRRRVLMTLHRPGSGDNGLEVGALGYLEQRVPGWWSHDGNGPVDRLHQLVLVCRRRVSGKAGRYLALYASEPAAKQKIARAIGAKEPFESLIRIDRDVLDAAFVERDNPDHDKDAQRRIRTLWLSGVHPSAAWKADAKVLMGPDLENALEPLGDQTYYFSAARCYVPIAGDWLTVGVAPRRSSLWAGSVPSWLHFCRRTVQLLDHIASAPPAEHAPLPVLAAQAQVESEDKIAGAYDMSVICPELLAEEPNLDPGVQAQAQFWAYNVHFFDFQPKAKTGPAFTVQVAVEGAYVGALDIEFERSGDAWRPTVTRQSYELPELAVLDRESVVPMVPDEEGPERDRLEKLRRELHVEATAVCRRPRWLTVRYDSGHTLSDGALYSVRHRDVSFDNWDWIELSEKQFNIWQEKPMVNNETREPVLDRPKEVIKASFDPDRIGKDRSLFCWVQQNWPIQTPGVSTGWLACDDGAGEIADFIHLDPNPPDGGAPLLSLIHVKASHSESKEREISTSDYEVVVGQAVKNLRSLDRIKLAEGLLRGKDKKVGKAVWKNGVPTTREAMVAALKELKDGYRRQVVVLQPRVTSYERRTARDDRIAGKDTSRIKRMQQLDTLLIGARADCRALQADLLVVGESVARDK